jgi:hypothetical protein
MKTCAIFAISLAGLLSTGVFAQTKGRAADDPDQKELYSYVLSTDKIQKLGNATKALMEASKQHPELNNGESSDPKNLDEMVKKLQKYPEVVPILSRNGLSPREYAVGFFTLMQASMAVGFKKSGAYKEYPPKMLQLVSKQNLDFVEQHFDEIQKLTPMQDKDQ